MDSLTNYFEEYRHPIEEIEADFRTRMSEGQLSPLQVSEYMIRLEHYKRKYSSIIEEYMSVYRSKLASLMVENEKLSKSKAEIMAQDTDAYKMARVCKVEYEYLESLISDIKYYQRALQSEWVGSK